MKITQDGKEIEVMTPEEVEAKLNEAKNTFEEEKKQINADWQAKIDTKETDLTKAVADKKAIEEEIAKGGQQAANFKILKDALDKKDADIAGLKKSIDDSNAARVNDFKTSLVGRISKGDKELEKKVLFHFDETLKSMKAESQDEITKKMESAYKLSVDSKGPSIFDQVIPGSTGRGYDVFNNTSTTSFTPQEKSLGAKLGITEEDYKKYGPKLKIKK